MYGQNKETPRNESGVKYNENIFISIPKATISDKILTLLQRKLVETKKILHSGKRINPPGRHNYPGYVHTSKQQSLKVQKAKTGGNERKNGQVHNYIGALKPPFQQILESLERKSSII